MPQKLIFYRTTISPYNAIYVEEPLHSVDISLKDIVWRIPQIKLSIEAETKVRKEILNNTNYEMYYRHWYYQSATPPGTSEWTWDFWDFPTAYSKTKYVIIGFQKDKENKLAANNAEFDFLNLENVQVLLNKCC